MTAALKQHLDAQAKALTEEAEKLEVTARDLLEQAIRLRHMPIYVSAAALKALKRAHGLADNEYVCWGVGSGHEILAIPE